MPSLLTSFQGLALHFCTRFYSIYLVKCFRLEVNPCLLDYPFPFLIELFLSSYTCEHIHRLYLSQYCPKILLILFSLSTIAPFYSSHYIKIPQICLYSFHPFSYLSFSLSSLQLGIFPLYFFHETYCCKVFNDLHLAKSLNSCNPSSYFTVSSIWHRKYIPSAWKSYSLSFQNNIFSWFSSYLSGHFCLLLDWLLLDFSKSTGYIAPGHSYTCLFISTPLTLMWHYLIPWFWTSEIWQWLQIIYSTLDLLPGFQTYIQLPSWQVLGYLKHVQNKILEFLQTDFSSASHLSKWKHLFTQILKPKPDC